MKIRQIACPPHETRSLADSTPHNGAPKLVLRHFSTIVSLMVRKLPARIRFLQVPPAATRHATTPGLPAWFASIALLLLLPLNADITSGATETFRMWTRVDDKKTIEAAILDKKLDSLEVKLKLRNGKNHWIKTDLLIPADREIVKAWVRPLKHITCRVVGSGRGYKNVQVKAIAGFKDMTVKAYGAHGTWDYALNWWQPIIHKVPAGKELTFTYRAIPDYWVEGWADDAIVDEERAGKKTGL